MQQKSLMKLIHEQSLTQQRIDFFEEVLQNNFIFYYIHFLFFIFYFYFFSRHAIAHPPSYYTQSSHFKFLNFSFLWFKKIILSSYIVSKPSPSRTHNIHPFFFFFFFFCFFCLAALGCRGSATTDLFSRSCPKDKFEESIYRRGGSCRTYMQKWRE